MSIIAAIKKHLRKLRPFLAGEPSKKEIDRRIIEAEEEARARAVPASKPLPPLPNNPYELDRRVRTMRKIFCAKFGYYPDLLVVGPEVGILLADMMNRNLPKTPNGSPFQVVRPAEKVPLAQWNSVALGHLAGNKYMGMEIVYESTPGKCQLRSSAISKLPPELR